MNSSTADMRLHGRWLLTVRLVWVAVTALSVGVFVASLPLSLAQLREVCTASAEVCEISSASHHSPCRISVC